MHIAILGSTSQIAQDFILSAEKAGSHQFSLFARRPQFVRDWAQRKQLKHITEILDFGAFNERARFDAIINFVGVGSPAAAQAMGASILDITAEFDNMALDYLKAHPETRYLFLSSGAAYGASFTQPADEHIQAMFNINHLSAQDWYGIAKFHAETRHRSLAHLSVIDIRVFSYFSRQQDISARFLLSDILRAIQEKTTLKISPDYIVRDFLHPSDFFQLIEAVLKAPATNTALDCYTRAPIDKPALLAAMHEHFGLRYEMTDASAGLNATGGKPHYYSLSRKAAGFGYQPAMSSWDGILLESTAILEQQA
ncbi:NAD-dependent epimerase/dehydratase family protein [Methylovorus menthalis]|uniref:NAD-dependent epimerase/dehydratase family protein n=1 Tax=Methylovorus menthalis TaxID=1002227 RepID=UPI001E37D079|nr:NAD-dependent epimerase/dehydratase family protein [Methylovorus menthalis]MCB4810636.1 NAD-dependent epimerase/dehydratase family protein [Methylovorus menthalis]